MQSSVGSPQGSLALALFALATPQLQRDAARAITLPKRVRVIVAESLERGEAPTPGLRVAVGCAPQWSFVGPPGTNPTLATLTLDERGTGEIELELPPSAGAQPFLWIQAVSPGFQHQVSGGTIDPTQSSVHKSVPARRGGTLYGRLRADPLPAKSMAQLRLERTGAVAEPCTMTARTTGESFAIHFVERGRYDLLATWPECGTGVLRDLALEPDGEPTTVVVDLGPGLDLALAGRVLDPDGAPVYPFSVSAVPAGFERLPREGSAWRDGFYGGRTITDEQGRFALHGLPPGGYGLIGAFDGSRPAVLSRELVTAGTLDARVEARVHRLALRVLDHEDKPCELRTKPKYEARPEDPVFYCRVSEPGPDQAPFFPAPLFALGARAIQPVEPGNEVHLAYAAPGIPLVEQRLRVPDEPWLLEQDLRLPPPVAPARLRVTLTLNGRPFTETTQISLVSPSGIDVAAGCRGTGSVRALTVAPGSYCLVVEPMHWLMCWGGDPEELVPRFAPSESSVVLDSGRETELELAVHRNARVRVALELPRRGADVAAELLANASDYREDLRGPLGGARVELWPAEGGDPLRPEFSVAVPEFAERPAVCVPWIAPGRESTSISAIPPGKYRLVLELEPGRTLEREVTLEEGRAIVVSLAP